MSTPGFDRRLPLASPPRLGSAIRLPLKSPLRVLILEDDPRDAKLTARGLEGVGFQVQFSVTDSQEGFQMSPETTDYDVILSDYNLRNWTALEALEILQRLGKDIPLIVVTGSLGDEAAAECLKQGAADFVLKDRPARLPVAVQRALEERSVRLERNRATEALRESELRYRTLFERNLAGVVRATRDGRILECNPAMAEMLGFASPEEVRNLSLMDADQGRADILEKLWVIGHLANFEVQWRRKDGTPVCLIANISLMAPTVGGEGTVEGTFVDITERKRAEAESTRLALIVNSSDDAIFSTSREGTIATWNAGAARMLGYTAEEIRGQHFSLLIPENRRVELSANREKLYRGESLTHFENENVRKDGSTIQVSLTISPLRDALGEITGASVIARDITERKTLEAQLQQAGKMEAIGRLAGGVAHDFNNLLTIINGYSEVSLDTLGTDHAASAYLNEIKSAGDRAASLTRQLLAFSRRQVLAPEVLSLNAVVADFEKMLARLIGKDIEVRTALDPVLGRVLADPGQIEQVIMNLAVNARDAMPLGGSLTIETRNVELDEAYARDHTGIRPGPYVMLAISDTGEGMDPETQARIFEPFFTTKEKGKGTGLGLATVYGIVNQSGGSVWVYSELGQGTVFKIYLPTVSEDLTEKAQTRTAADSAVGTETILVVEDEESVHNVIRLSLASAGYKILGMEDAESAVAACAMYEGPIDLLLTDVVMPKMSGPLVAKKVAALRPNIKILYMSGYTDDAIVHHGVLTAGIPFIQKPFSPSTLRKKVREVLDGNR